MRTRRLDTLLLLALTGAWTLCLLLHLSQQVRGGFAWVPVYVDAAAGPDAYPVVSGFWAGGERLAPGLQVGDALATVRDGNLAGASRLDFLAAVYALPPGEPIALEVVRDGARKPATLALEAIPSAWRKTLVAAGFGVLGSIGFWRLRGTMRGRAFYLAMMAYAFHWTDFWGGAPGVTQAAVATFAVSTAFTAPLAIRAFQSFPDEIVPPRDLGRLWPWAFLALGLVFGSWAFGVPFVLPRAGTLAVGINAVYLATLVFVLTRNYRASGLRGRRQLKWVVLGFWVGLVPILLVSTLVLAAPELWWLYESFLVFTLAIPVCIFIAVIRFNLFDVNRLLTSAASYSVVGTIALASVFLVVPRASAAASAWVEPEVSQPMLALFLAGAALVGLRRIDDLLQDRLYPERRALEEDAGRVRTDLASCEKPADVLTSLGVRLRALLQLETVAIYVRSDEVFAPVFARGPGIAPAFDAEGALATRLEGARDALDPSRFRRGEPERADRAALESMAVELVVPISLRGELAAFVCLGGKGSGDIFTPSDVALLLGLADKAGDELLRFEQAEVERQSRQLTEELRRYVPGAVAREIDEGLRLAPGERDVSVLFVDIRGYTPFSEGQTPDAIFAAVSRYTDLVSGLVDEYGGSVVEFHGDGLMAVFGAPRPLADKEEAAVRAACAISRAVPGLELEGADGRLHRLDVGVGVATGSSYVGPLKTSDRAIWVALGNTTNLAARLESATRDLDVAVVVDTPTREAAGPAANDFVAHPALRVKGRDTPIDVFTWTREAQETEA